MFEKSVIKLNHKVQILLNKKLKSMVMRSCEFSFNYFNKNWFVPFNKYIVVFKLHFHIKDINNGSPLYKLCWSLYNSYKIIYDNCSSDYLEYMRLVNDNINFKE